MVMCGLLLKEEDEKRLVELNVKDSKQVSKPKRELLFDKIKDISYKWHVVLISPEEIDNAVNDDSLNLNRLEAIKSANIINLLNPDKVIIDAPSSNINAYKSYTLKFINISNTEIILEHKADVNYPIVSAASIIAKVVRDNEIEKIKKKVGIDFGSGYMADPKTAEFLKMHSEKYHYLFRKSWLPYKYILNEKFQRKIRDFSNSAVC